MRPFHGSRNVNQTSDTVRLVMWTFNRNTGLKFSCTGGSQEYKAGLTKDIRSLHIWSKPEDPLCIQDISHEMSTGGSDTVRIQSLTQGIKLSGTWLKNPVSIGM